jgi:hypothetical protein
MPRMLLMLSLMMLRMLMMLLMLRARLRGVPKMSRIKKMIPIVQRNLRIMTVTKIPRILGARECVWVKEKKNN